VVRYTNTTSIACTEIGKIVFATSFSVFHGVQIDTKSSTFAVLSSLWNDIFEDKRALFLMSVPCCFYSLQNLLMFESLQRIDSALYQIIVQTKTLTTALFGMCLLSKTYTQTQWASFILLSIGVILANCSVLENQDSLTFDGEGFDAQTRQTIIGAMFAFGCTITSGFAGTVMEAQFKNNSGTIFIKNIQMSLFGLVACCFNGYFNGDLERIFQYGFFQGFNTMAIVIVILNICGGFIVAMVIKRGSAMTKTFLSGISILLIVLLSFLFLPGTHVDHTEFWAAVMFVLLGNYLFNKEKARPKRTDSG